MTVLNRKVAWAIGLLLSLTVTSAGHAADVTPLEYYKANLSNKGDGVYENHDLVYVITTSKYDVRRAASRKSAMFRATEKISQVLKKWLIDQILKRDGAPKPANEEMKIAWEVLERLKPGWMFPDWNVSFDSRVIYEEAEKSGRYVIVMVGSRGALEKLVSTNLGIKCEASDVLQHIKMIRPTIGGGIGAGLSPDICEEEIFEKELKNEWDAVDARIKKYLADSPFAVEIKKESVRMAAVKTVTNRVEELNPQMTMKTTRIEIKITETIPRMQMLFLSGGSMTNFSAKCLPSGENAKKHAFGNFSVEEKAVRLKAALCENPCDCDLWNLYGRIMNEMGDKDAAIICYRNALRINPSSEYPLVNLSDVYSQLGYKYLSVNLAIYALMQVQDAWSVEVAQRLIGCSQ